MKKIALIGSTGSIGTQVLNVCRRHSDKFSIISLSAGNNINLFNKQVKEFMPKVATVSKSEGVERLNGVDYYFGDNAFTNAIIKEADIVVISLVGYKGIIAVLDAIHKGLNIALANKESLVVGGDIVIRKAKEKGVSIVPIDSEHSAIWQALNFDFNKPFKRIVLTASGGAFRDLTKEQLQNVKAVDALKHPNWTMGAKITVDCATLVNKAFEVVEAKWLYNTNFDKIDVIIHRQSIIHSMVEFNDCSTIAQLSYPSMELPIQMALTYPNRIESGLKSLDFASIGSLTFEKIDKKRFPCFDLVLNCAKKGGGYPAVCNGANEKAVELFLRDKISFNDIYVAIDNAVQKYIDDYNGDFESLEKANEFAVNSVTELFGE